MLEASITSQLRGAAAAVAETLGSQRGASVKISEILSRDEFRMIYFTGSGSGYHAGLVGQMAFSSLAKKLSSAIPASELPSWIPVDAGKGNLLVAISNNGESTDVLAAVSFAKSKGMTVLGITSDRESPLAEAADYLLITKRSSGGEISPTWSYLSELAIVYSLAIRIGQHCGFEEPRLRRLEDQLGKIPTFITKTVESCDGKAKEIAYDYSGRNFFFFLGAGPNYPTALQSALEIEQMSGVFAEGFAAREFLHGAMMVVDERTPVFVVSTPRELEESSSLIESFQRFHAPVIVVSERPMRLAEGHDLTVPFGLDEILTPLLYILPVDLFAYYSKIARAK